MIWYLANVLVGTAKTKSSSSSVFCLVSVQTYVYRISFPLPADFDAHGVLTEDKGKLTWHPEENHHECNSIEACVETEGAHSLE